MTAVREVSAVTVPRERPILFSGPMVRALLDGRKTQTRRVLKPQPADVDGGLYSTDDGQLLPPEEWWDGRCPYGQPGDRLWVKETYALHRIHEPTRPSKVQPTLLNGVAYRADGKFAPFDADGFGRWRPSIHMPRWASRLTLEVTQVRVQRLQDISEEDAKAEGVRSFFEEYECIGRDQRLPGGTICAETPFRASFEMLWSDINGDGSWAANPWVWAINFRRVQP